MKRKNTEGIYYKKVVEWNFSKLSKGGWGDFNNIWEVIFNPFLLFSEALFSLVLYPVYILVVLTQVKRKVKYRKI